MQKSLTIERLMLLLVKSEVLHLVQNVVVELLNLKTKCLPVLLYGLEHVHLQRHNLSR